ncbi:Slp family lipoprotein [Candidatus Methylacidithermus pantelleriae]|uniref:Uncharacterized protein n=1 Tax=Candidatus Methylacidithermus pantelleriae TaxID=2744239 RepID=A0A8J2BVE2_9BACT|nr:Slp family lipoprotein [Candidatus Methylacidithermus pantelleriae]CAF0702151.1 conserved hypothetical protein [Candidatus Methylacidithermus pantelleriae]
MTHPIKLASVFGGGVAFWFLLLTFPSQAATQVDRNNSIRLRGTIVRTIPCRGYTELEIQPAPPSPFLGPQELRFYSRKAVPVVAKGLLDPAIYSPGRVVRVLGRETAGSKKGPLLRAYRVELWPKGIDVEDLWDSGLYVRSFPPWSRDPFYPVWWGW